MFDATRLVWRVWAGRLPTGIDRVCLAYLDRYGPQSLAMVQRGPVRLVLSPTQSDALFALLRKGGQGFRRGVAALLTRAAAARRRPALAGRIYLNIGHTGLNAPGLAGWLERRALRPVFLIHDLIPITHPQFARAGENRRHAARIRQALDCAAGIIANSADTLGELAAFAAAEGRSLPPGLVALLGAEPHSAPDSAPLPAAPYFVTIGTIEGRKNHALLLDVWEGLIARHGPAAPRLVLIGQRGWEAQATFDRLDNSPQLAGHVLELGRCSDARMVALIDGARALLMPSFVEGFGIPVIEALQRGVPVIASDLPVYRELAGEIPLYLDPADRAAWGEAVMAFTADCAERQRQLAQMDSYRAPDWASHFARVDRFLAGL